MTWQHAIEEIDRYIAELAEMMNTHPRYGVAIQQSMAVLMFKRMQAVARLEAQEQ